MWWLKQEELEQRLGAGGTWKDLESGECWRADRLGLEDDGEKEPWECWSWLF